MSKLNWSNINNEVENDGRVVVVPRTPDFDHPYAHRVPTPPRRSTSTSRPTAHKPIPPQHAQPRSNPVTLGLIVAVAAVVVISAAAFWVMTREHKPSLRERQMVAANLANSPVISYEETAKDFVDTLNVSTVRVAGNQTRANLNGKLYKVGDVIENSEGIIFIGADPDGEYLLFRAANGETLFRPIK
ncbi:hypothetical protein [Cerasicoccus fimbriatus]|uniref:hypothetical protein n=1 Tax=Cerasicoccus fimbriatus TaxID=3014554 RepID=UPI0022B4E229|nr:hypothetical protein [Cerasicoccus sp. TK19100]